jgi:hypothetical protein
MQNEPKREEGAKEKRKKKRKRSKVPFLLGENDET